MQRLIALITLGCFCTLASFSWGRQVTGAWNPPASKTVLIWRTPAAENLASVYNLTPDGIDTPVNLFNQ